MRSGSEKKIILGDFVGFWGSGPADPSVSLVAPGWAPQVSFVAPGWALGAVRRAGPSPNLLISLWLVL